MSDPSESRSARGGRGAAVLWVVAVILTLGATGVMVLSDDVRILRLGLVGALWAAVLAGLAVTGLRSRLAQKAAREDELKRVYELELQREVAARQEFEAETEAAARRSAAEESRDELDALRAELANLRSTLEQIVSGDMLVERVALRAESTRVRSWGENEAGSARLADSWGAQMSAGSAEYGYGDYANSGHVQYAAYGGDQSHGRSPTGGYPVNGAAPPRTPPPERGSEPAASATGEAPEARTDLISPVPNSADQDEQAPPIPDTLRDSARPAVVRRERAGSSPPPNQAGSWPAATGELPDSEPSQPAAEPQGNPGAHTQGRSVSELLAAFGGGRASKRRRRQG